MFQGDVSIQYPSEVMVVWDHGDRVPDEIRQLLQEIGEGVKASFSRRAPVAIEHIVIVSDIEKAEHCQEDQNEKLLLLPVRGYVATQMRVHRNAWEDSIRWFGRDGTPLTWTKVTG